MSQGNTVADLGEFGLIDRIASLVGPSRVIRGIGDDAAVLDGPGDEYVLVTVDMLVQDVHFRLSALDPFVLGRHAVAVNVSDIAAMGGTPHHALVSLALPSTTPVAIVDGLYLGMRHEADRYGLTIVGGNTTSTSGPLAIDVVLLGSVQKDSVVLRSGAVPGDLIAVTGPLGGAATARLLREAGHANIPHAVPRARVHTGQALASAHLVHAMMDLSDGLGGDIHHLAEASHVSIQIVEADLPITPSTRENSVLLDRTPEELALFGGEDYELLMALAPDALKRARQVAGDVVLHVVGHVTDRSQNVTLLRADGSTIVLPPAGWQHF